MNVSDMIEHLESIQEQYGNLEIVSRYKPNYSMCWLSVHKPVQNHYAKNRGELVDKTVLVVRV